jgi:hypothetical protein
MSGIANVISHDEGATGFGIVAPPLFDRRDTSITIAGIPCAFSFSASVMVTFWPTA